MTARPLADLVHPTWARALEPVAGTVESLGAFLREEVAAGHELALDVVRRRVEPPAAEALGIPS